LRRNLIGSLPPNKGTQLPEGREQSTVTQTVFRPNQQPRFYPLQILSGSNTMFPGSELGNSIQKPESQ